MPLIRANSYIVLIQATDAKNQFLPTSLAKVSSPHTIRYRLFMCACPFYFFFAHSVFHYSPTPLHIHLIVHLPLQQVIGRARRTRRRPCTPSSSTDFRQDTMMMMMRPVMMMMMPSRSETVFAAACVSSRTRRPGMAPSPRRGRGTTTSSKEENEESPINIFNRSSKSFFFGAIGAKPHAHTHTPHPPHTTF